MPKRTKPQIPTPVVETQKISAAEGGDSNEVSAAVGMGAKEAESVQLLKQIADSQPETSETQSLPNVTGQGDGQAPLPLPEQMQQVTPSLHVEGDDLATQGATDSPTHQISVEQTSDQPPALEADGSVDGEEEAVACGNKAADEEPTNPSEEEIIPQTQSKDQTAVRHVELSDTQTQNQSPRGDEGRKGPDPGREDAIVQDLQNTIRILTATLAERERQLAGAVQANSILQEQSNQLER